MTPQTDSAAAGLRLAGYADPQSVEPGEVVRFMVTSEYVCLESSGARGVDSVPVISAPNIDLTTVIDN
jgi:hypothetical protein